MMQVKTITVQGNGNEMLLEDFIAHGITVPAGFVTDGASTPVAFWWLIPPFKRTKRAAVVHDYLCRNAETFGQRTFADKLFKVMLIEDGLSTIRAHLGYLGVRLGAYYCLSIGKLKP
jgi:hypothetical protein